MKVSDILPSLRWSDFKIHVAQKTTAGDRPIDDFVANFDYWQNGWNGNFQVRDHWNRPFVFSMIELPDRVDEWLFGGVFKVVSRKAAPTPSNSHRIRYKMALDPRGEPLIGRLVIKWKKHGRAMGRLPEKMLDEMFVASILPEEYVGEDFPGHDKINHTFVQLQQIWKEKKPDWYVSLRYTKGVYMITDEKTGKRYVGSAYGEDGLWTRWGCYMRTATGHNDELVRLINEKGFNYAERNFRFSLLEQASSRDSEKSIIQRESFWKNVMMSRDPKYGYNKG